MGTSMFLILLTAIVLGAPTLIYPFGRDQGEYAWIAASTLNGNLCYSDIFNVKPPLTHLVHQAALLLFGHSMASIRILDLLWQGATAILIFMIAKQSKYPSTASVLAAILYLFSYYEMDFWMTAQTDGFLTLPIAVAILLFLHAQQKNHLWIYAASGMSIGLAILFKYPIGIIGVFLPILIVIRLKKNCLLPVLAMGTGSLLPLVVSALIMFMRGNLADFLWIQSTYISKYSTISYQNPNYMGPIYIFFRTVLMPAIPGWYGLFIGARHARPAPLTVIAIWWISAVFHFVIQNKFYDYHALPIFAPLALMTSYLFVDVFKTRDRIRFALGTFGVALMVFPIFVYDFPQKYIRLLDVVTHKVPLQTAYHDEEFDRDGPSSHADLEIAEYLISNTGKDETIFIWGFDPSVYFLSERGNATRFAYNFPLYGPKASPELQQEFISEIQVQIPVYVVIVRNDSIFHVTATADDSWAAFNSFDEFHTFVLENYHIETTIEDFILYRLNQ